MGNVNVSRIGKEAQADRELDYSERLMRAAIEADPIRFTPALSAPQILALAAAIGGAWLVVLLVLVVARVAVCWDGSCYDGAGIAGGLLWAWVMLPVLGGVVGFGLWAWGFVAQARAVAARMAVTRDRYGNPVSARAVAAQRASVDPLQALLLADATKRATAPYEIYRGADALSLQQVAAQQAPELAPPAPVVVVDSPSEWLPWLKERPHLLLAAESGAGKSVLENVTLDFLMTRDGAAVIIDCHWSPLVESDEGRLVPKWGGVPPAATTYEEARETLRALRAEYDRRMAQLKTGEVLEGRFPPIFIMVDETPEVMREIVKLDRADVEARRAPKGTSTWDDAIVVFGSGGRKINMHGHLLSQSPLVEDIGMNSAMRKNFFRIALAHAECRKLIGEEPDKDRKAALLEALRGRRFPAAVERNGEVWILSRDGLLEMMPERIEAAGWVQMPRRIAEPQTDGGEDAPKAAFPAPVAQTDGNDALLATLRFLRQRRVSRDAARAMGLEFDNDLWVQAGRLTDGTDG